MSTAYIALGSNLGDRQKNLNDAINLIKQIGIELIKSSKIIESNPVGGPPQNKYLNSVIKVETVLSPDELLNELLNIETTIGRIRTTKNAPRPIDLDILLYENICMNTDRLTIPHPRMLERDFVLNPLKEIDPNILNNNIFIKQKISN